MSQQVVNSDQKTGGLSPQISLTCSKRLDGPHWLIARILELDKEFETQNEKHSMSWKSKLIWWCDPRHWLRKIIHLEDTPHSIALGTSIGIFIGLTPTFGVQMLLVLAIAFAVRPLFRFNKLAAIVAVYVSNPFTMIPIYWFNYRLGTLFVHSRISWHEFVELFHYSSYSEWLLTMTNVFYTLGAPLIVGSLLVATVIALPTYPIVLRLVVRVQSSRKNRLAKKFALESEDRATLPPPTESSSVTCRENS